MYLLFDEIATHTGLDPQKLWCMLYHRSRTYHQTRRQERVLSYRVRLKISV